MTADIRKLPVGNSSAREHYDVTLEQLGAWLAEAETLGGYRALHERENEAGCVRYLAMQVVTREKRAAFWEARLRAELQGLSR